MYISRLALDRFRSWTHCLLDLKSGVNILQGANGLGKTNIVEAIEVLSTGSSHRTSSSLPLVQRGESSAVIRANVHADGPQSQPTTIEVTVSARGANRGRINGGASLYMRDIVGRIPCVAFTPDDQRLVSADPAIRRNFINQAGALLDMRYAQLLQQFTHIAKQRAALLKTLAEAGRGGSAVDYSADAALSGLEIWTGQFIEVGIALTRMRADIMQRLSEPFHHIYRSLTGDDQQAVLQYEPSFDEVLLYDEPAAEISRHFQRIYPGEVARGQNLIGPHRDDMTMLLNGMPAREFASNGEMWTMALALKMALYAMLEDAHGAKPIVILDDVFAQLDDHRREQILRFASEQDQVLITVASAGDVPPFTVAVNTIDVASLLASSDMAVPDMKER